MRPVIAVLSNLLLLALLTLLPQAAADPLRSPACLDALATLTSAEDRARASRAGAGADEALLAARRGVRQTCLGVADAAPPPPRVRPPLAVGSALPPRAAMPPSMVPDTPARPGAAPPRPPPLVTLTGCDATGCWASDGTRLQRQGSLLLGPRGYCSQLGGVLNCP